MIARFFSTGRRRVFSKVPQAILMILAAIFAAGVIYGNLFVISDRLIIGILFVSGIFTLMFGVVGATPQSGPKPSILDWVLSILSAACGVYFMMNASVISNRISLLETFTPDQLIFGSILLVLTLEATRRTTGMGLTIVVLMFLAYNLFGSSLPAPFGHGVDEYSYVLDVLVFTTDGVFGVPIQVVASYVFLFVLFGTFLSKAGGGDFFYDLASNLTGKTRGGPAKVAVIASGLYGTMSGSATSDVVTTGSITIPIMKRLGYSGRFAGAVEVAASTGGSAMPPVMGSAAFILAEYTGLPYRDVVYAALIPAFLYYFGVFGQVHLRAVRHDLKPVEGDVPTLRKTMSIGWVFLIPILIIIAALMRGFSPTLTAGIGAAAVVIASAILPRTRMSLWQLVEALGETTLRILPVAGACAAAGLVIGGLSMTGLGMKAANLVIAVSGGDPFITLVIAALIAILLGLGMPTPSAYILSAVLVSPAMIKLGFPLLETHFFLLYYAILSALTPPIAVAAMAAAAIANDDPFMIAIDAVKLATVGFCLPFVFMWNPAILGLADPVSIFAVIVGGICAVAAIAIAVEGMLERQIGRLERLVLLGAAIAAVAPHLLVSLAGTGLIVVLVGRRLWRRPDVIVGTSD